MLTAIAATACFFAVATAVLYRGNVRLYLPAPQPTGPLPAVSVLIPARNEADGIAAAVEAVQATVGIDWELFVLDDASTDATATIVEEFAERDPRVHVIAGAPLPDGWCGKQHACWQLAKRARFPLLCFLDADVRLAPDGLARLAAFQQQTKAALVSGVPRQLTGTLLERLLIPLIHFLLLEFLPVQRMRASTNPAYGAGCGQLFLADATSYWQIGGHEAVKRSLHDGVTLPRAFRRAGLMTDLCDATDLAECRMYQSGRQVWGGLAKNATEGVASPAGIVPWTFILGVAHVAPLPLLLAGVGEWYDRAFLTVALAAALHVRLDAAVRFKQDARGALLHPLAVLVFLTLQWYAFVRWLIGKPAKWRGRKYGQV